MSQTQVFHKKGANGILERDTGASLRRRFPQGKMSGVAYYTWTTRNMIRKSMSPGIMKGSLVAEVLSQYAEMLDWLTTTEPAFQVQV